MVKVATNFDFQNAGRIVNLPASSAPGDAVNKSELDAAIASLSGLSLKAPVDLDCSTNPDYPLSDAGQSYYVTVGGKIGGASGVDVQQGDTIYCKNPAGSPGGDEATVGADFFIVEGNKDQATETQTGLVALATQTEVNDGLDAIKAVTPLTLQTKLNNAFNSLKYNTPIGDGTNTSFVITHGLNDANVHVQIKETAAPFGKVIGDIDWTDANNVQVTFINPPTTNQYTVSIR